MSGPTLALIIVMPVLTIGTWVGEVGRDPQYGAPGQRLSRHHCRHVQSCQLDRRLCQRGAHSLPDPDELDGRRVHALGCRPMAMPQTAPTTRKPTRCSRTCKPSTTASSLSLAGVQPNDPDNTVERWLGNNAYKATDTWYGDYPSAAIRHAPAAGWRGTNGRSTRPCSASRPSRLRSCRPAPPRLRRRASRFRSTSPSAWKRRPPRTCAGSSNCSAGRTFRWPSSTPGPTTTTPRFSTLPARETLVEKAGLLVPANTPEGEYRLIAGLYNPDAGGARLVTVGGPDFVELGTVRVVNGEYAPRQRFVRFFTSLSNNLPN